MRFYGTVLFFAACASSAPTPPPAAPPPAAAPAQAAPAAAPAEDPERAATRVECGQAVDHVAALPDDSPQAKQVITMLKEDRDQFIDKCVASAKKKDFDCVMRTKTFPELGTCPQPGQ